MTRAVEAVLDWAGDRSRHRERLVLPEAALQGEPSLASALEALRNEGGATVEPGSWIRPGEEPSVLLPHHAFRLRATPVPGRYYPRLAFSGLAAGPRDLRPCRLLESAGQHLRVETNHPLIGRPASVVLRPGEGEAGPSRFDQLFEGPGMQLPPPQVEAAYFPPGACGRQDEASDACFYADARFVHHLDSTCRGEIAALHGRVLGPGMRVLDLMSSWASHLPEAVGGLEVSGLGMNREELEANPCLSHRVVHDLNLEPWLPFPDRSFDGVLCTASVEYLIQPRAIFAEVARVLAPGGLFVVSFSDRWFPPKVIHAWTELHPFERLGLVLWLMADAGFADLRTETLRGLRRPAEDRYAALRDYGDPLFAVWGRAA
jgi:Methyltransferase domain